MSTDPNRVAFDRIIASHPWITGVRRASEVIAGMPSNLILHAAPPTNWSGMSDLMRGGMIGAALFERIARTPEEAIAKAEAGEIKFDAAQNYGAMAGGVGSITASLPVVVVEDRSNTNRSCHFLMEGLQGGEHDDPGLMMIVRDEMLKTVLSLPFLAHCA